MRDVLAKTDIATPQLLAVVQALQSQSIDYDGPFVTSRGRIVFRVKDKIVLDWELMALFGAGKLDRAGISALLSRLQA